MSGKRPFYSRYSRLENNNDYLDFDGYDELVEEGYQDKDIAKELNVDVEFLQSMKKDIDKEY